MEANGLFGTKCERDWSKIMIQLMLQFEMIVILFFFFLVLCSCSAILILKVVYLFVKKKENPFENVVINVLGFLCRWVVTEEFHELKKQHES